jgi:DNA-binding transcriptional MerR regulator
LKSPSAFRTISEVAIELDLPQHVLRFWEKKFTHIKPIKRGGGRRYYRPADVDILRRIQRLLHKEGYTIRGVQKVLKDEANINNNDKTYLSQRERTTLNSIIIELEEIKQLLV